MGDRIQSSDLTDALLHLTDSVSICHTMTWMLHALTQEERERVSFVSKGAVQSMLSPKRSISFWARGQKYNLLHRPENARNIFWRIKLSWLELPCQPQNFTVTVLIEYCYNQTLWQIHFCDSLNMQLCIHPTSGVKCFDDVTNHLLWHFCHFPMVSQYPTFNVLLNVVVSSLLLVYRHTGKDEG